MQFPPLLVAFLPLAILAGSSLILLLLGSVRRSTDAIALSVALAACVAATIGAAWNMEWQDAAFGGSVAFGGIVNLQIMVFCAGGVVIMLFGHGYMKQEGSQLPEFYTLMVFAIMGMVLMTAARDFVVLFVGLELMSLCFYVLAGLFRTRASSNEAALKYFFLGAFATGFFLYGVALLYGMSGSTSYNAIHLALPGAMQHPLFLLGCSMVLVTLFFKLAAVPFHMWAPDVYVGSPTSVSAFLSSLGKAAALTALATVSAFIFEGLPHTMRPVIAVVAILSMLIGNIAALRQQNVKRMLAYSSIAHAGYALVGLASLAPGGRGAMIFYAIIYTFMQAGAFCVVGEMERNGKGTTLQDFVGLSSRRPVLAFGMAIFLFSLAGIPPLGGFFGKYYLFAAAVASDQTWLAIVAVIASLISVYYYIGLVLKMYFHEPVDATPVTVARLSSVGLWLSIAIVVLIGIFPGTIVDLISRYLS